MENTFRDHNPSKIRKVPLWIIKTDALRHLVTTPGYVAEVR